MGNDKKKSSAATQIGGAAATAGKALSPKSKTKGKEKGGTDSNAEHSAKASKQKKTEAQQEPTEDQKLRDKLAKDSDEVRYLENSDEFREMTLNPHEFICLMANSYNRQSVMKYLYHPNYEFNKQLLVNVNLDAK